MYYYKYYLRENAEVLWYNCQAVFVEFHRLGLSLHWKVWLLCCCGKQCSCQEWFQDDSESTALLNQFFLKLVQPGQSVLVLSKFCCVLEAPLCVLSVFEYMWGMGKQHGFCSLFVLSSSLVTYFSTIQSRI